MAAFVAIADRDWFDFLAAREDVVEVNFWQPSAGCGRFRALTRGEPLLFKLRAPVNAIVGGRLARSPNRSVSSSIPMAPAAGPRRSWPGGRASCSSSSSG
jgi:hypothetical protein